MKEELQQLVEMGASVAQARAALKQYKDVMLAAERFLEGKFDHIQDEDGDVQMEEAKATSRKKPRPPTPDEDDDDMGSGLEEDEDADDYIDYDSDFSPKAETTRTGVPDVDPYAGIFFSKDRREEVIEIEEDPEIFLFQDIKPERVPLMSQGQWMKGCPEGGEQSFLFGLYSQLSEGQCPCPHDCGTVLQRKKSDFFAIFPEFSTYINRLCRLVHRTCEKCQSEFCFACGESISSDRTKRSDEGTALFHCSNIQGVILGIGLSMLEQCFAEVTSNSADNTGEQARKRRKMSNSEQEAPVAIMLGTGTKIYAKKHRGIGYAGDQAEDRSGQIEAQAAQRAKDEKIGKMLRAIRVYLPNLHRPGGGQTSDYLVHPTALAHLRRRFNYVCSTLLRNDSLADMSERSVLYFELMEWLETISNHEALASMMAMPIMVVASVKSVTMRRGLDGRSIRERVIVYEGSSGPRELLEGIVIQAHAALKGLERLKSPDNPPEELTEEQKRMTLQDMKNKSKDSDVPFYEDNERLIAFCRRILHTAKAIDRSLRETKGDAFVDRLHGSLPKLPSSNNQYSAHIKAGETEEEAKKVYMEWATRARFEYCDLTISAPSKVNQNQEDNTPHYKFHFNNEARMLANSDIPKRSLAIAKELAILTTNLPVAWDSSIFLRVDETRVDIIKALITGPQGTPYYNGCFLFDIFLGSSYNQSPPSVKYMTTNGGKYRFNPNLYADGKVCLSLLGTWSGPGWVSGKSTLLQVLISIQSMILCEEPYLNEPAWANSGGSLQSRSYSANVRRMVVKTAMLGNLRNPPEPFVDVIRTHFRLKAKSIIAQLNDWLSTDDGKPTANDGGLVSGRNGDGGSFQKEVEELKRLLTDLKLPS
ncbi:hypothetical protein APHAL10511_001833 [Amanita phalloides]|nr:hypothetical protein APHAL10511_001833 [Amanita phalloides]